MRRYMKLVAAAVLAVSVLAGCQQSAGESSTQAATETVRETESSAEAPEGSQAKGSAETSDGAASELDLAAAAGKHHVVITVKDYGTISVELDGDAAPITVANFLDLAGSGFYDGLTFHRIIDGFMMQGGDPNGDGTGGSGQNIEGEFSNNGYDNPLSHTRGTVSMARSSDYNSASSQFFIVQEDASESLDGDYAVFGYVTEGMDIVDEICQSAQPTDGNGTIPAAQQPVITTITIRSE